MAAIHRHSDARECPATTIVVGQTTVFTNGLLWAVDGDINTDGNGQLIAAGTTVFAEGIKVIVVGDTASADDLCEPEGEPHCTPGAVGGSSDSNAY